MIIDAQIDLLLGETTTIRIYDKDAAITFVEIELDPLQLANALGRHAHLDCKAKILGLDKIGKIHENETLEFPLPGSCYEYGEKRRGKAFAAALEHCPEGWTPHNYFQSQNSFFTKDGQPWARATIRRWVEKPI